MAYIFSEAELQSIFEAARAALTSDNWSGAYQAVMDAISTTELVPAPNPGGGAPILVEQIVKKDGVDAAVFTWAQGALKVNSDSGYGDSHRNYYAFM